MSKESFSTILKLTRHSKDADTGEEFVGKIVIDFEEVNFLEEYLRKDLKVARAGKPITVICLHSGDSFLVEGSIDFYANFLIKTKRLAGSFKYN